MTISDKLFEKLYGLPFVEFQENAEVISYVVIKTSLKEIEVYDKDLPQLMTFNEAIKHIQDNIGNGWRIPTIDELKLIHKHDVSDDGTFIKDINYSSEFYMSSTPEYTGADGRIQVIDFQGGSLGWGWMSDTKISCRMVRDYVSPAIKDAIERANKKSW